MARRYRHQWLKAGALLEINKGQVRFSLNFGFTTVRDYNQRDCTFKL